MHDATLFGKTFVVESDAFETSVFLIPDPLPVSLSIGLGLVQLGLSTRFVLFLGLRDFTIRPRDKTNTISDTLLRNVDRISRPLRFGG